MAGEQDKHIIRTEGRLSALEVGLESLTDNVKALTQSLQQFAQQAVAQNKPPWGLIISAASLAFSIIGGTAYLYLQPYETRIKHLEHRVEDKIRQCGELRDRITRVEVKVGVRGRRAEEP